MCLGHLGNSEKEAGVAEAVLAREKQENEGRKRSHPV